MLSVFRKQTLKYINDIEICICKLEIFSLSKKRGRLNLIGWPSSCHAQGTGGANFFQITGPICRGH